MIPHAEVKIKIELFFFNFGDFLFFFFGFNLFLCLSLSLYTLLPKCLHSLRVALFNKKKPALHINLSFLYSLSNSSEKIVEGCIYLKIFYLLWSLSIPFQKEYEAEGIAWKSVPYTDNKRCVEALDGPTGVFGVLNEVK